MTKPISGNEVYKWPEFRALMHRLGWTKKIWEMPTTELTLIIPACGLVRIEHQYFADDEVKG